jgi:hypothetical protein
MDMRAHIQHCYMKCETNKLHLANRSARRGEEEMGEGESHRIRDLGTTLF